MKKLLKRRTILYVYVEKAHLDYLSKIGAQLKCSRSNVIRTLIEGSMSKSKKEHAHASNKG